MKNFLFIVFVTILFLAFPFDAQAILEFDVACEGCGELEYKQSALRAAPTGGVVVVTDGYTDNIRKYSVMLIELFDGGPLELTATEISPDADDLEDWGIILPIIERIYSSPSYCGPGFLGSLVVPDFNYGPACEAHDYCYAIGGTNADRLDCDVQLRLDLLSLGASAFAAATAYRAVRAGGWGAFTWRSTSGGSPIIGNCTFLQVCEEWEYFPTGF